MKTKIIRMGNSTSICIPRIVLEQCHMDNFVDIQICDGKLIIKPVTENEQKVLESKIEAHTAADCCWYEDETEWV